MMNAFTVDLEDWFNPSNLHHVVNSNSWNNLELRIVKNTKILLDLLDKHSIQATFFVLGWIAEKVPDLVKKIDLRGHEIASHGYLHVKITDMTPDMFRHDIEKSLTILKSISDKPVLGYRAQVFTITNKTLWALDILKEFGFVYDSSIYPFKLHPDYGIFSSDMEINHFNNSIIEVPLSCVEFAKFRIPCSGGGYFRLYPYKLFKSFVNNCNSNGRPLIFYIHPWELDPHQPKLKLNYVDKFRHYQNLNNSFNKLESLLDDFTFTTIANILVNTGLING